MTVDVFASTVDKDGRMNRLDVSVIRPDLFKPKFTSEDKILTDYLNKLKVLISSDTSGKIGIDQLLRIDLETYVTKLKELNEEFNSICRDNGFISPLLRYNQIVEYLYYLPSIVFTNVLGLSLDANATTYRSTNAFVIYNALNRLDYSKLCHGYYEESTITSFLTMLNSYGFDTTKLALGLNVGKKYAELIMGRHYDLRSLLLKLVESHRTISSSDDYTTICLTRWLIEELLMPINGVVLNSTLVGSRTGIQHRSNKGGLFRVYLDKQFDSLESIIYEMLHTKDKYQLFALRNKVYYLNSNTLSDLKYFINNTKQPENSLSIEKMLEHYRTYTGMEFTQEPAVEITFDYEGLLDRERSNNKAQSNGNIDVAHGSLRLGDWVIMTMKPQNGGENNGDVNDNLSEPKTNG